MLEKLIKFVIICFEITIITFVFSAYCSIKRNIFIYLNILNNRTNKEMLEIKKNEFHLKDVSFSGIYFWLSYFFEK